MDKLGAAVAAAADLPALHRRVVDAFAAGDAATLDAIVADDFRMLASGPTGAPVAAVSHLQVRRFGTTALVHALVETGAAGRLQALRRTDVFDHDGRCWRLVAVQLTPLRDGVPAALQRGVVPPYTPWSGADPHGDDETVLRRLNERYVQSFRESDVGWYDAHLAADYVVTNGDGSFVDRAGALAAFARPVFATQMRSFPVDRVNIRRFGELALIEAENAYELNDGRTGISRYTDIWHAAGGRWSCVAAHITVVKAP